MNEIIIRGLTIGYKRRTVAENLWATIGGGMTCLIGRNGVGKSTLLRTLAGMQPALKGGVTLCVGGTCHDLASSGRSELARLISVVLTERVDVSNMTVAEMVAMGRMPYTGFFGSLRPADHDIAAQALRTVGMESFASRDFSGLSDGERQKIMIAKALAQQTPVIILDEPTAFLDYPSKVETMRLLASLARKMGKIVVASTHDIDIAMRTDCRLLTIEPQQGLREVGKEELKTAIGWLSLARQADKKQGGGEWHGK